MKHLLGKVAVEDFESWKSTFHTNEAFRAEHGERGYHVFQSADDPNEVVVLFEWDEKSDPIAFFESEEMRPRMAKAGIKGAPDLTVLNSVEQKSAQQPSA